MPSGKKRRVRASKELPAPGAKFPKSAPVPEHKSIVAREDREHSDTTAGSGEHSRSGSDTTPAPPAGAPAEAADDKFNLARFVHAQDTRGMYDKALAELRAGRKKGHWMWYVFPQARDLGRAAATTISLRFAISGAAEARAYLAHPVLGDRLLAATRAVADGPAAGAEELVGAIDAGKLHACMTLFARAAGEEGDGVFQEVLDRYFGEEHAATMEVLEKEAAGTEEEEETAA